MVTLLLALVVGNESRILTVALIVGYGIMGAALGYFWPERWRQLGLYLIAFWVLLFLFALVLSDPTPWNLTGFLKDIAWFMSVIVAAFIGIAVGKVFGARKVAGVK